MQRAFCRLATAMLLAAACFSATAQTLPVAGREYLVLDPPRPAATFEAAENFALTYYALEASGELARLHGAVYENQHFDDLRLGEEKNLLDWLARNGVDAGRFREVRNSAENRARVAAGHRVFEDYNVRGAPSIAVDGRYVTSARLAGSVSQMMEVVAYLVNRVREERLKK